MVAVIVAVVLQKGTRSLANGKSNSTLKEQIVLSVSRSCKKVVKP